MEIEKGKNRVGRQKPWIPSLNLLLLEMSAGLNCCCARGRKSHPATAAAATAAETEAAHVSSSMFSRFFFSLQNICVAAAGLQPLSRTVCCCGRQPPLPRVCAARCATCAKHIVHRRCRRRLASLLLASLPPPLLLSPCVCIHSHCFTCVFLTCFPADPY